MDVSKTAFRVVGSVFALVVVVSAQQTTYVPPHLVRGDLPSLPGPMVVGGGEVMIEVTIDQTGALTHPVVLRTTPPFTNLVLDAVSRWSFEPARATVDGRQAAVDGGVLIAAIYRPPTLVNGPTVGNRAEDLAGASSNAPYAVSTAAPTYPLQAQAGAVVLYEISLDQAGQIRTVRAVDSNPAFDAAAKDALVQWKFRGATAKGQAVPSTAYVIFGFSQPVTPAR
jgi:TonB family protein